MTRPGRAFSIERRIRHKLLVLLLFFGALLLLLSYLGVRHLSLSIIETRIDHDAESIVSSLSQTEQGTWELPQESLPLVYRRVGSGHYYTVISAHEPLVSRSLWDARLPVRALVPGQSAGERITWERGEVLMLKGLGVTKEGQPLTVWVAEDIRTVLDQQLFFTLAVAVLLVLTVLMVIYLQSRAVRAAFRTLEPLQQQILEGRLDQPHRVDAPDEVQPLVRAIDRLIERSKTQVERSRTSLGNLTHEMKHPIQRLRWSARELESEPSRAEIDAQLDALQRIIDRELRRARISGQPSPGTYFDPASDLDSFGILLERIYDKTVQFERQVPDHKLPVDRDDLLELLGNLLDNAWRFARHQVRLQLIDQADSGCLKICVEDDGPGVDPDHFEALTQRGTRLDESEQNGQGSGLGIAISQAVVESYGGTLRFSRSELGGLCVTAVLHIGPAA